MTCVTTKTIIARSRESNIEQGILGVKMLAIHKLLQANLQKVAYFPKWLGYLKNLGIKFCLTICDALCHGNFLGGCYFFKSGTAFYNEWIGCVFISRGDSLLQFFVEQKRSIEKVAKKHDKVLI